jgi:hypothetical protein
MQDPIRTAHYREPNTKRAAALLTVGLPFLSEVGEHNIANVYDEKKPYQEGKPGHIFYIFSTSRPDGVAAEKLQEAFDDSTFAPSIELDALVERIKQASPALGQELEDLLPLALMSYLRGGFENRERILDMWRKAKPMVLIRRGENAFTLVERNPSEKVRERFGLD